LSSLIIHDLQKRYPEFLLSASFEAASGTLASLLGPSGCGKSTTLSLITGIEQPDSGEIRINDRIVNNVPPWKRNVGLVFQNYALFPNMNVYQNIAYGMKVRRLSHEYIRERISELLKLVGLEGYEQRHIGQLSGGEQQRIALARALAPNPDVLLLDEPLSALDAKLRERLRDEIQRIQQELRITTIYVTHDQDEALSISDKIIVMNQGKVEQVGTPEEIYRHPATLFTGTFIGDAALLPLSDPECRNLLADIDSAEKQKTENMSKQSYLLIRPEHIRVQAEPGTASGSIPDSQADAQNSPAAAAESDACTTFHGAVLQKSAYKGPFYHHYFTWRGKRIIAASAERLTEGRRYTLHADKEDCRILQ